MDKNPEKEERVSLDPLKPTQALKALLAVDRTEGQEAKPQCPKTWQGKQCRLREGHLGPCQFDLD